MATVGLASPAFVKRILELEGYALVIDDTEYWVLARSPARLSTPIILTRRQGLLLPEALQILLRQAGISEGHYQQLCDIVNATKAFAGMTFSRN
jgi:hypothetical protein